MEQLNQNPEICKIILPNRLHLFMAYYYADIKHFTNRKDQLYVIFHTDIKCIWISIYQYIRCHYWMGSQQQTISIKLKNDFLEEGAVAGLIMAVATDAFWVGHFVLKRVVFFSNNAFLCRTSLMICNMWHSFILGWEKKQHLTYVWV